MVAAVLTTVRPSSAEESAGCETRVEVDGSMPDAWAAELARVCADIEHWRDLDPSAHLRLVMRDEGADVEVAAGDGRVARRHVASPADLWLVVQALMVVPPASSKQSPRSNAQRPETAGNPAPTPHPAPETPAAVPVEVGGDLTGRVSGSQAYLSVGVEAWAALRAGVWVLGLLARWDALQRPARNASSTFDMQSAGAGFLVARRSTLSRSIAFDVGSTAELLTEAQSVSSSEGEHAGTATDACLGALARLELGASRLRFNVGLTAEVSPLRLQHPQRIDSSLPVLPAWSVGLGVGVAGDP